jgi:hypothetical protein
MCGVLTEINSVSGSRRPVPLFRCAASTTTLASRVPQWNNASGSRRLTFFGTIPSNP